MLELRGELRRGLASSRGQLERVSLLRTVDSQRQVGRLDWESKL